MVLIMFWFSNLLFWFDYGFSEGLNVFNNVCNMFTKRFYFVLVLIITEICICSRNILKQLYI